MAMDVSQERKEKLFSGNIKKLLRLD
jgi:hypothetical protein